ncbi:MAG: hypothetical protein H0W73_09855 [Bacteroidetes bacterium]|nr:hypothetical protein [Bacteroidota bacterium]
MKKINLLSLLLITSIYEFATAQTPGALDATFGTAGKVTTALFNPTLNEQDEIRSIAIQPDGKIVAAGFSNNGTNGDFSLARYLSTGVLDNTFGLGNGVQKTQMATGNDEGYAVAIQSDGKIIVAGMATAPVTFNKGFALARYTAAGVLDNTFGASGKVITQVSNLTGDAYATCMAIQNDGKIVVAGYVDNGANNDIAVARFNSNGTIDNTFGMSSNGFVVQAVGGNHDQANCIIIQPDGKIIVAGFTQSSTNLISKDSFIIRYNSNGLVDNTFGSAGLGTITNMNIGEDEIFSMALQANGNIVTSGFASNASGNYDIAIARYTSLGNLDNTFNSNGKIIQTVGNSTDVGRAVTIQTDGSIVVAGFADIDPSPVINEDFIVLAYNTNGTLENSFGTAGIVNTQFYPTGVRKDVAKAIAIQTDGKILVGGYMENATDYDYAISRYYPAISTTAISETSINKTKIVFYPNPVQQSATLEFTLKQSEIIAITLSDIKGRCLKTFLNYEVIESGDQKLSIEFPEDIPYGSYFITIVSLQGEKTNIKIVK